MTRVEMFFGSVFGVSLLLALTVDGFLGWDLSVFHIFGIVLALVIPITVLSRDCRVCGWAQESEGMEDRPMTNLEMLFAATASLDNVDKRRFEDFFIGMLAMHVVPEVWVGAIANASVLLAEESCSTDTRRWGTVRQ
jgi:hypothetical protein